MIKEKEVEEMARVICGFTHSEGKCDCINNCKNKENQCTAYCDCKALYNAGYRKVNFKEYSRYEMHSDDILLKAYKEGLEDGIATGTQQAIKEFAEKLRDRLTVEFVACDSLFIKEQIDKLLKEYGVKL